jgi:hypothetical protein
MSESLHSNGIPSDADLSTTSEYVTKSAIFQQWSKLKEDDKIVTYSKTFMKPDHEIQFMNHIAKIQEAKIKNPTKREGQ